MRFFIASLAVLVTLLGGVSAHFSLQYPIPRGVFDAKNEVTFCDGYPDAASNRSDFPLNGGVVSFHTGHPSWTFGVILSTAQNPTSFDNFSQVVQYFQYPDAGNFCFNVNLSSSANATTLGLRDGVNATLQFVFNGGDGNLYQCADVVLRANASTPSNVTCANTTETSHGSSSAAPSGTSPAGSSNGAASYTLNANEKLVAGLTSLMVVVGAMITLF
ncbi:hypothetical protein NLI96_g96 [Meripilus lineatus]|uniref:Copper acquisition factor BIM1-like domain-containing protein n=1 Tax=Meripilus lineatus TaxID=2056292 RepID=A0AAD5VIP2_9APHY|nr:hypothetical protein NLI96_g96 [Physisporinus lineatus]